MTWPALVSPPTRQRQLVSIDRRRRTRAAPGWTRSPRLDDEEGADDAGGVLRELLSLAAAELLNMDTNLWRLVDGESLWPSCTSGATNDDHLAFFELTGKLVGLALLRGEVLPHVRFTAPLLRRLLRQPCPDPEDELRALDSELYRNKFAFVRTCSAEDLAALDQRFESTGLQRPLRFIKGAPISFLIIILIFFGVGCFCCIQLLVGMVNRFLVLRRQPHAFWQHCRSHLPKVQELVSLGASN